MPEGTSESQLRDYCQKYPWFHGVFASDEVPAPSSFPPDSAIIVNYTDRSSGRVGHWCAILHVNHPHRPPAWFDSFGQTADAWDDILDMRTRFDPWLQQASREAGWGGHYDTNHESLQCLDKDSCGHYSAFAVRTNCLPQDEQGRLRAVWKPVWNGRENCEASEKNIRRIVRL